MLGDERRTLCGSGQGLSPAHHRWTGDESHRTTASTPVGRQAAHQSAHWESLTQTAWTRDPRPADGHGHPLSTSIMDGLADDRRFPGRAVAGADDAGESPTWSLGDILQSIEEPDKSAEFLVLKVNDLVQLLQRYPLLKHELVLSVFSRRVHALVTHTAKEVVAAGYRVARYAVTDVKGLRTLLSIRIDTLVIRSLAKEAHYNVEREQALKFVRAFLDIPGGVAALPAAVTCAVVAAAAEPTDRLSATALETLAELLLADPRSVSEAGGMRVLLQTLVDGPTELADSVVLAFLYLLDRPETRNFVWPGKDLNVVLSVFTELQERGRVDEAKLKRCARVLSVMIKSWAGLFYLCMYDLRALSSLVQALRIPVESLRDIILDFFFDIFNIKSPSWATPFLAGRKLTSFVMFESLSDAKKTKTKKESHSLVLHYTALLLVVFIEADLHTLLLAVIQENREPAIVRKATLLLGEIIGMTAKTLPGRYANKIQVLGPLFSAAAEFDTPARFAASTAIYEIEKITSNLTRAALEVPTSRREIGDPVVTDKKRDLKVKLSLHLDDTYFRTLLMETQVLSTKNYTKWNWDILIELMQGPLLNPKRLDEAIRATKFMKRLMSFYRPFKKRFSVIRRTEANLRYVRAGSILFKTLLANPEGVKYLMENKLLRQIAECLAQTDPYSGIAAATPLFSKAGLEATLSSGYFTLIGTLSTDANGVMMLERWHMFNMLYHITELDSRNDLIRVVLTSLDYRLQGHPRIILSKVLTTANKELRMFTTAHLGTIIDDDYPEGAGMVNWATELLVGQLYDPDIEVCQLAVKVLGDACASPQTLDYIIKCIPVLDHLGDIGAPLLLRFLSTSDGFRYLRGLDYIESQLGQWFDGGNDGYVKQVETELALALLSPPESAAKYMSVDIPVHFYRELARTAEGCWLLRQKGHAAQLSAYIHDHKAEQADVDVIRRLKGCMWALGHLGSLEMGLPFLDETGVIDSIVEIACTSAVWSLRGTAFFILGLISSTMEGLEIVDELAWETVVTVMGEPRGLCLPIDLGRFLAVPEWQSDSRLRSAGRGIFYAGKSKKMYTCQKARKDREPVE
ncbi:Rapamycin-insensitive companion of mTOR, N-term-domain-containing protein [Dipodascopsis tothii]|uniref:Rapamycin-insensitive companion of mTOR, N-term-domain-containing protein n=1 Tax=Dipodascopsis tothii TaxID=44089 RepID=UPI0034CE7C4D